MRRVEAQIALAVGQDAVLHDGRVALHPADLCAADAREVDAAAEQLAHCRGVAEDGAEHDLIEVGCALVVGPGRREGVVGVAHQRDRAVRWPDALDLVRPGADYVRAGRGDFGVEDAQVAVREREHQQRAVGRLEHETHGVLVDHLGRCNRAEGARAGGRFGGGVDRAVEGIFDRAGVEGVAIGEAHAVPQRHGYLGPTCVVRVARGEIGPNFR